MSTTSSRPPGTIHGVMLNPSVGAGADPADQLLGDRGGGADEPALALLGDDELADRQVLGLGAGAPLLGDLAGVLAAARGAPGLADDLDGPGRDWARAVGVVARTGPSPHTCPSSDERGGGRDLLLLDPARLLPRLARPCRARMNCCPGQDLEVVLRPAGRDRARADVLGERQRVVVVACRARRRSPRRARRRSRGRRGSRRPGTAPDGPAGCCGTVGRHRDVERSRLDE